MVCLQSRKKAPEWARSRPCSRLLGDDTTVSAEVEILSSRMVLGRVVSKLKLDIVAVPDLP
jgi:tyrosine-protein kinase Etk/Wzc